MLNEAATGTAVSPVGVTDCGVDDSAPVGWFSAGEVIDDELVVSA